MLLEKLNIFGWQTVEPAIMAGLLSKKAVLLIGETGTNKSEGLRRIAKAMDLKFHRYDASKAVFEDVIGFPNPKSLSNGEISYVQTPMTLWDKEFILIDEINRAALQMQNKWFEVINEATLMGIKTKAIHRFAAINPSSVDYLGTSELDLALRDRFALSIHVPSTREMNDSDLSSILENGDEATEFELKDKLAEIDAIQIEDGDRKKFLLELSKVLRWEHKQLVSGRRLVLMDKILTQALKLGEMYEDSVRSIMRFTMYDVKPEKMDSILDLVLSRSPVARKTVKMLSSTPIEKLRMVLDEKEDTKVRASALGRLLGSVNTFPTEKKYVYSRILSTIELPALRDIIWTKFSFPNALNKNLIKAEAKKLKDELENA